MNDQNQSLESLREVRDIRQMMERSSRFISLSGLSGISAGVCALIGAAYARNVLFKDYYEGYNEIRHFRAVEFTELRLQLLLLAGAVFVAAFLTSFYFTWRKTKQQGLSLWSNTTRRLFWNVVIPLGAGAAFIMGMLQYDEWRFVAPACLVFYGLALVNASKYTLPDIRYLGYCEIALGLINMQFIGYGLYFWATGFGVLHIIYGALMWSKYDRTNKSSR